MKGNHLYWFIALLVAITFSTFLIYIVVEHNQRLKIGELEYLEIGNIILFCAFYIFGLFGFFKVIHILLSLIKEKIGFKTNTKNNYLLYWFIALLIAMIFSMIMIYIATEHNPQGEFISNETGELEYLEIGNFILLCSFYTFSFFGLIRSVYILLSRIIMKEKNNDNHL